MSAAKHPWTGELPFHTGGNPVIVLFKIVVTGATCPWTASKKRNGSNAAPALFLEFNRLRSCIVNNVWNVRWQNMISVEILLERFELGSY
jgi:hypothetical protein